jgi:hypothetical protein
MYECNFYKPHIYSYREVNNSIQHILSVVHVWDFHINNLDINLHSFFYNTTILHEENNSLNLKVLALLQQ